MAFTNKTIVLSLVLMCVIALGQISKCNPILDDFKTLELVKLDDSTTVKPDDSTTAKPDDSTTVKPDDSTTLKPDDSTTAKPDDSTTVKQW